MGGSGTSSTNQIEAPRMRPITTAWIAIETGSVTAALDPPFRPEDSISASSNMLLLPTSGTPALLRRFRRPRGRSGFLTQIECLLPVLVRHRDKFLLFGRVRLELRLLAVEEVDVSQGVEVVRFDPESLLDRLDPGIDDAGASRRVDVRIVVGAVPGLHPDHDVTLGVVRLEGDPLLKPLEPFVEVPLLEIHRRGRRKPIAVSSLSRAARPAEAWGPE